MAFLSKSVLIRLITLDIAESVTDSIESSAPEGQVPTALAVHVAAAKKAKRNCFKDLVFGKERLELDPKEYERYKNALLKVRAIVKEQWPGECPAEALVILAMDMTEQVRDKIKKNKRWIALIDAQFNIYQFYDPELEIEHMDEAESVSKRILKILREG